MLLLRDALSRSVVLPQEDRTVRSGPARSPICSQMVTLGLQGRVAPSSKPVRAREAAGHEPAGGAAGPEPRRKVGFGADAAFALPPGEAVGEAEHLAIGEAARFVAL